MRDTRRNWRWDLTSIGFDLLGKCLGIYFPPNLRIYFFKFVYYFVRNAFLIGIHLHESKPAIKGIAGMRSDGRENCSLWNS